MTISDILSEGAIYGERYLKWLNFICVAEATIGASGNILMENDHDGAGLTFCGLTQRDDNLKNNPQPEWVAATFRSSYWNKVEADALPHGVGEEVANIAVNEGVGTAGKILQRALGLPEDGIIGDRTIAFADARNAHELCLDIAARNDQHYKAICEANPNNLRFLRGWLNRDEAMVKAFA